MQRQGRYFLQKGCCLLTTTRLGSESVLGTGRPCSFQRCFSFHTSNIGSSGFERDSKVKQCLQDSCKLKSSRSIRHLGKGHCSISGNKSTNAIRFIGTSARKPENVQDHIDAQDKNIYNILQKDMTVIPNFLSEQEEKSLLDEVDRYMKRLRYEYDHWDNAIHGYRETEKKSWNEANQSILNRVKSLAFHSEVSPLAYVHVLDISKEGYIKPHVDAVRFCGDTITGMCLISSCVMRLALEKEPSKFGDIYLPQRCLYIMKGKARYDFTHEVLKEEESVFKGEVVPRDRRISVICRNEPRQEDTK